LKPKSAVDFKDFVIIIWNFCTLDVANMATVVFDLYTGLTNHHITLSQMLQIIEDIQIDNNISSKAVSKLIVKIHNRFGNKSEEKISLKEFCTFSTHQPALLQFISKLQSKMRRSVSGTYFWKTITHRRMRGLTSLRVNPLLDPQRKPFDNIFYPDNDKLWSVAEIFESLESVEKKRAGPEAMMTVIKEYHRNVTRNDHKEALDRPLSPATERLIKWQTRGKLDPEIDLVLSPSQESSFDMKMLNTIDTPHYTLQWLGEIIIKNIVHTSSVILKSIVHIQLYILTGGRVRKARVMDIQTSPITKQVKQKDTEEVQLQLRENSPKHIERHTLSGLSNTESFQPVPSLSKTSTNHKFPNASGFYSRNKSGEMESNNTKSRKKAKHVNGKLYRY